MSVGIYKITSPSGKIYIGQSINIENRFKQYKNIHCKKQIKLYNSLKKHGWEKHSYEIIEECSIENLNEKEIYWKKHYCSVEQGLNCNYYDFSPMRNKKHTIESKNKISKSKTGHICYKNPIRGKKISETNKGLKQSIETCIKKSKMAKGKPKPENFGLKISLLKKGKPIGKMSEQHKINISNKLKGKLSKSIIQYDLKGNFIKEHNSIREANISLGKNKDGGSIPLHLTGKLKKAYGYLWKYKEY